MSNYISVRELVTDYLKGITPKYVSNSNVVVLNQKCIRNNQIDYSFAQFHDPKKLFSEQKIIKEGDILINSTGQGTAGRCAFVKKLPENKKVIVDSHILIIRVDDFFKAGCLEYSLFSIEKQLQTFMDGSTGQGEFDKERLFNVVTSLPIAKDRIFVYQLLNKLDTKIDLNNKINSELEAMAKTLYNYWFVQFDFPDKNGKPYKTSGGKMVWNEELKREIPEAWEVKSLADLTKVSSESINPLTFPNKEFKHYSIPTFDETGTYGIEKGSEIKSNKFTITNTDILVSKLNPWFNRVAYSTDEGNLISSTEFVVWRSHNLAMKNYLYMIARDASFITYCTQSATGTSNSHKRVNPTVMMKYKIVYENFIAELFGSKIGSAIKMYAKNQVENKSLSDFRDWLLPMLMNGQVIVKN